MYQKRKSLEVQGTMTLPIRRNSTSKDYTSASEGDATSVKERERKEGGGTLREKEKESDKASSEKDKSTTSSEKGSEKASDESSSSEEETDETSSSDSDSDDESDEEVEGGGRALTRIRLFLGGTAEVTRGVGVSMAVPPFRGLTGSRLSTFGEALRAVLEAGV